MAKEKARPLRDEPNGRNATLRVVVCGRLTQSKRPGLLGSVSGGTESFRRTAPGSIGRLRLAPVHSNSGSLGLAGRLLIPFTAVGYSDLWDYCMAAGLARQCGGVQLFANSSTSAELLGWHLGCTRAPLSMIVCPPSLCGCTWWISASAHDTVAPQSCF